MHNIHGHPIVIPFYVCDVQKPILSVTRLSEQGFHINFNDNPTITHCKGFTSSLKQKDGLYFLPTRVVPLPDNMVLSIRQTSNGTKATISPVTLTSTGLGTMRGGNTDLWTYNDDGYLVRVHKRARKALFTPDANTCPVPLDNLDNFQVHQGTRWCLTKQELGTQQQWSPDHEMGFEHLFDQMS